MAFVYYTQPQTCENSVNYLRVMENMNMCPTSIHSFSPYNDLFDPVYIPAEYWDFKNRTLDICCGFKQRHRVLWKSVFLTPDVKMDKDIWINVAFIKDVYCIYNSLIISYDSSEVKVIEYYNK